MKTGGNKKPGFMVYHDICESLMDLTDEELGKLMRAMIRYSMTGEVPEFEDRALSMIWKFIRQKLDKDDAAYYAKIQQRLYASYSKVEKENSRKPMTYDEWKLKAPGPMPGTLGYEQEFEELRARQIAKLGNCL